MKKLIIVGSARKGNSLFLANTIAALDKKGDSEIVRLSNYRINYCTGCLECDETHKCIINDDMDILLAKVIEADVIIMISPTRYSLLSGDCKVFIDRLNPTAVSGDIEGKKFIAITVGQSEMEPLKCSIDIALQSFVDFAENANLEIIGKYAIYSCYDADSAEKQAGILTLCEEIVSKLRC